MKQEVYKIKRLLGASERVFTRSDDPA